MTGYVTMEHTRIDQVRLDEAEIEITPDREVSIQRIK